MDLQEIEARDIPELAGSLDLRRARARRKTIHTLSAENRRDGLPSLAKPCPMTSCEEPYIGEESISRPPGVEETAHNVRAGVAGDAIVRRR